MADTRILITTEEGARRCVDYLVENGEEQDLGRIAASLTDDTIVENGWIHLGHTNKIPAGELDLGTIALPEDLEHLPTVREAIAAECFARLDHGRHFYPGQIVCSIELHNTKDPFWERMLFRHYRKNILPLFIADIQSTQDAESITLALTTYTRLLGENITRTTLCRVHRAWQQTIHSVNTVAELASLHIGKPRFPTLCHKEEEGYRRLLREHPYVMFIRLDEKTFVASTRDMTLLAMRIYLGATASLSFLDVFFNCRLC